MNTKLLLIIFGFLLLTGCKSPKERITDTILYEDSIGYWNYEWPRES